ncbi:Cro/CI family transcriptional regulator [Thiomonas sp.]|uniref:Cro/CI family transcriptional regulator n=1 Tax=Thiomonas sp. TaxID=2047785 RepID=UPI00261D7D42|nr:Cro/CI family transcriptional regulator [Thiomonas sp.]
MLKTVAINLLGGTRRAAARAIGISPSAVSQWPDELPPTISDRVLAALYRREHSELTEGEGAPSITQSAPGAVQPQEDGHE